MTLRKNQLIPLSVTAMSHEGEGIGRHEGMAVFVPKAAIGDMLTARIVKVRSAMAHGIIEKIEKPSPDRVENDCPHYRLCGGCGLRHISPEAELRIKDSLVQENLRRIAKADIPFAPPMDTPGYDRYRNKAQYPVRLVDGKVVSGFFMKRSHRLIPVEDCLLQPAFFADITRTVCAFCEERGIPPYDEERHAGLLRNIVIRHAGATGQTMVSLVINGESFPRAELLAECLRKQVPSLSAFLLDHNLRRTNVIGGGRKTVILGSGYITDELCGVKLALSPDSFYQVNRAAAELLYRQAGEYAAPGKSGVVLDLYCGTGAIGLTMAHAAKEIIGVEAVPAAVEDAKRNAAGNGVENARFLCMDAGEASARLAEEGLRPDVVLLDPPRGGCEAETLAQVCAMEPARIVYISCNSATLSRDLVFLRQRGYEAKCGRSANLFCRTSHMESVVLLEREKS